jgi:hypothetical protein
VKLTVEELMRAILAARDLKALKSELCDALEIRQAEVRREMIQQLIDPASSMVPSKTMTEATNPS